MGHDPPAVIDKLDGTNFRQWRQKLGFVADSLGLSDVISAAPPPFEEGADRKGYSELLARDRRLRGIIGLNVTQEFFDLVEQATCAFDVLTQLEALNIRSGVAALSAKRAELEQLRKGPDEKILTYLMRARNLRADAAAAGDVRAEPVFVDIVLKGLGPDFTQVADALRTVADVSGRDLNLDDALKSLLSHESRLAQDAAAEQHTALLSKSVQEHYRNQRQEQSGGGRGRGRGRGGRGGSGRGSAAGRGKQSKCHNCGEPGHWKADCPLPARAPRVAMFSCTVPQLSSAATATLCDPALSAQQEQLSGEVTALSSSKLGGGADREDFFLDSGASDHSTHDRRLLSNYKVFANPLYVELADGSHKQVVGKGTVDLPGAGVTLHDVLHIPTTSWNLLSMSKAVEIGEVNVSIRKGKGALLTKGKWRHTAPMVGAGTYSMGRGAVACSALETSSGAHQGSALMAAAAPCADAAASCVPGTSPGMQVGSALEGAAAAKAAASSAPGTSPGVHQGPALSAAAAPPAEAAASSAPGTSPGVHQGPALRAAAVIPGPAVARSVSGSSPEMLQGSALYATAGSESAELWHQRFAHASYGVLADMQQHGMVNGVKTAAQDFRQLKTDICEPCIMAKHSRGPFPSSSRNYNKLDVVATDLCGPLTSGIGGYFYFLTALDLGTGRSATSFLRRKNEAPAALKNIIANFERQTERKVKAIRCDRGREFLNAELGDWLWSKGIVNETTAPYTAQQNGAAEKLNRTLLEKSRAMLSSSQLNQKWWPEAISTANYMRNRLPYGEKGRTPYEAWTGTKPDVSNLRVFGCKAYALKPKQRRRTGGKLDEISQRGMMVGYEPDAKAYRIKLDRTGEVIVSRDVIFNEGPTTTACDMVVLGAPEQPTTAVADPEPAAAVGQGPAAAVGQEPAAEAGQESATAAGQQPAVVERYPRRQRGAPDRLAFSAVPAELIVPQSLAEAQASPAWPQWEQAIMAELASLKEYQTYSLQRVPTGTRPIATRWVFDLKRDEMGRVVRYKARLVAKGFHQRFGVDYDQTYAPTSNLTTFRALLATMAAQPGTILEQLDVSTAFLNGELDEIVYVSEPPGYENGQQGEAWLLHRALYGLKQAPRVWYKRLKGELEELGFKQSSADPCLYVRDSKQGTTYVLTHVDDILVGGAPTEVAGVKTALGKLFSIKDMGLLKLFLGMEITWDKAAGTVLLTQKRYVRDIIDVYGMDNAKISRSPLPMGTRFVKAETSGEEVVDEGKYKELVGALLYLAVCTRPDISQAVSALSRYCSAPTQMHWNGAKQVLRYLAGTRDEGLRYGSSGSLDLVSFCDADYAGCLDTRKSTTGYVFCLNGGAISWTSKVQPTVAASTTEAEYMASSAAGREALWMRKLLPALGVKLDPKGINIQCDNQACLALTMNPIESPRSKHIDVLHHFIRDRVERSEIRFTYVGTDQNVADCFTKPLAGEKLKHGKKGMGLTA